MLNFSLIQAALEQAVADGVFPGAVLAVRHGGGQVDQFAAGLLSTLEAARAVQPSTVYDLASLTKPLSTVTAVALLIQAGQCQLHDRVESMLPELAGAPIGQATIRHLLMHSSGLPGWRGYYERLSPTASIPATEQQRGLSRDAVMKLIRDEAMIYERGARSLYSDLGFMLLGMIVERRSGVPLQEFFRDRIAPLAGTAQVGFVPAEWAAAFLEDAWHRGGGVAPTEQDPWRGRLLCGEVHDENAAALGGVAGHAGLFGTAAAVLAVTGAWLEAYHRRPSLLDARLVEAFTRREACVPGSSWALGWDMPSSPSSAGRFLPEVSFGHLGYTGTSVWIDPLHELEVVVLSNRVHPTRKNERIKAFRPLIHELVYREYAGGD
ncbi:MAG: beta-lactamase family protein [Nitrospira sp.]|nr:beta-lactamase family protein [Nitrospira sp.]